MKLYCAPRGGVNGSEAVYSLLAYAFRTEYSEKLPVIAKTPNGKPYFQEIRDIHFSLSHSATHVFCALSDSPVGADIESPRQISTRALKFFCSSEELALFDPLDLWVLKESYLKLIGATLPEMRSIKFSLDNGKIVAPEESVISKLYGIDGCRAAVSAYNITPPDSIELLSHSLEHIIGSFE